MNHGSSNAAAADRDPERSGDTRGEGGRPRRLKRSPARVEDHKIDKALIIAHLEWVRRWSFRLVRRRHGVSLYRGV